MRPITRRAIVSSLVVGFVILGTAIAVAGSNGNGGAPDAAERAAMARHREKWEAEVKKHYTKTPGQKRAGEIPEGATRIVKKEMVPLSEDYWIDVPPPPAGPTEAEKRTFMARNKNMRVYYDNGACEVIGPFEKPPRRAEIVDVYVDGELDRTLIIED